MVILQQRAAGRRANSGSSIAPELYVEGASRAGIFQSTAAKTQSLARSALVQGDGHGKDTAPTTQGRLPGWDTSMLSPMQVATMHSSQRHSADSAFGGANRLFFWYALCLGIRRRGHEDRLCSDGRIASDTRPHTLRPLESSAGRVGGRVCRVSRGRGEGACSFRNTRCGDRNDPRWDCGTWGGKSRW
jgi:hypothetical protein